MADVGNNHFSHDPGKTFYLVVEKSSGKVAGLFSERSFAQELCDKMLLLDNPTNCVIDVYYLDEPYVNIDYVLSEQKKMQRKQ